MEEKKVVIYNCFGGFSNTGFTAALATIEALKEVGLDKACIACSVGLPANVKDVSRIRTKQGRSSLLMAARLNVPERLWRVPDIRSRIAFNWQEIYK